MIEKGDADFEAHGHAHLIGVAQQHVAHVVAEFGPTDPRKVIRQCGTRLRDDRMRFKPRLAQQDGVPGAAPPLGEESGVGLARDVGKEVTAFAGK